MRLTFLGIALFAAVSSLGAGYITSVKLPDGTTMTLQDEGARQEIQGILSQKYLVPSSVKAGDNVFVTTNEEGEVTISAVTGTESDFTTNNVVLVDTIKTVAPEPGNYSTVSNAAMISLSRAEAEAGSTEWMNSTWFLETPPPDWWQTQSPMPVQPEYQGGGVFTVAIDGVDYIAYYEGDDYLSASSLSFQIGGQAGADVVFSAVRTRLPTMADLDAKADKVASATSGNFAALDANGNLMDSLKSAADFATAEQGAKADAALPKTGGSINGDISLFGNLWLSNNLWLTGSTGDWVGITIVDGVAQMQAYTNGVNSSATFLDIVKTANGQSAIYAPLESPSFTGAPTAPTPNASDNSTNIATTAFVKTALESISVTPLTGNLYDFQTNADVYRAIKDIIEALGGSVTNFPAIP